MVFLTPSESPVFDPAGAHRELMAESGRYARIAGIQKDWLWQPLSDTAGPNEVKWVTNLPTVLDRGTYGILYTGSHPGLRVEALCGALVRNFLDARVRDLGSLFKDSESANCTVLFIPDFCLTPDPPSQYVRSEASRIVFDRYRENKQTVLYATSQADVDSAYGSVLGEHVKTKFLGDPR